MTLFWLFALSLPVALAVLLALGGPARRLGLVLAPGAGLPALGLALFAPAAREISMPWLLLGANYGLDTTGRVFLFFTAVLWTLAGHYGKAYMAEDREEYKFYFFFLLSMAGNLGLIVSRDIPSFYLFFALMTLSGYGLVIHYQDTAARRAARVYIVMALIGEACLLSGFLFASHTGGTLYLPDIPAAVALSPHRDLTIALILVGFGIKAGALPLHMWLPLAHPVAPTPASAVLSGSMIKAGLFGWLRFLPIGEAEFPVWGSLIIAAGLVAAFFGVLAGVTQNDPKANLAYSSISQMGIINMAVGVGMAVPDAWPVVLPAILVYVVHHALAKGALFAGAGIAQSRRVHGWQRVMVPAGLLLCALALAGAPLTSGAYAKTLFKEGLALAPLPWPAWLDVLLPFTSVGTGLLMGRFLLLTLPREPAGAPPLGMPAWASWMTLLGGVAAATWFLPGYYELDAARPSFFLPIYLWASLWPVLLAAGIVLGLRRAGRRWRLPVIAIAPGDVLGPLEWTLNRLGDLTKNRNPPFPSALTNRFGGRIAQTVKERLGRGILLPVEKYFGRWEMAGALVVLLTLAMLSILYLAPKI